MFGDRHARPAGGVRLTALALVLAASVQVSAQDFVDEPLEAPQPVETDGSPATDMPFGEPETIPVEPLRETAAEDLHDAMPHDTIQVTGSRLKRLDFEGPLPVMTIGREMIDQTGNLSVADVLREQTFNSFGSFTPTSGTGAAQGGAEIDLRGLGSERTLVLLDGRRLPNNPAFSGAAQNVNNIPLALVERIEVLREGASAIYGSDAIGGVINIITRKDYSGIELSTQIDRPDARGGDANTYTLVGGASSGDGNFYFSLEHYDKDIIFNRDREEARNLSSALGFPGTIYQYDASGAFVDRRVFDDCPSGGFDSDPEFPDSANVGNRCRYRFASVAALTSDIKRDSLTVGANYDLTRSITGFARMNVVSAQTFGRFAPAPVDSIVEDVDAPDAFGNLGVRIDADNPNNPNPGSILVLNYRPVFLGPRDNTVDDQVNQYLAGLGGDLDFHGFTDWEVALSYNRYKQNDTGINYGLVREFQDAIDEGRFNPFDPDPAVAEEFRYTTANNNLFKSVGVDARINYELEVMDLTMPFAFGVEYRDDEFAVVSDAQSAQRVFFDGDTVVGFQQSNVFGSAGGSATGERSYKAAFVETALNLFDKRLELGFALRLDDYSDVGNSVSPKVSAGYRPIDTLLVRASYSEGFRAPDLESLYGAPAKSAEFTVDTLACQRNPADEAACEPNQRTVVFDSNPELDPEESESVSAGIVWNATPELVLSLDYFNVKVTDAITTLSPQAVFDNEARCDAEGRLCSARQEGYVVRTSGGGLIFAYIPTSNAARLETDGLDLNLNYRLDTGYGRFNLGGSVSKILSYKRQDSIGGPLLERLDTLNANGEIFPEYRINAILGWTYDAWSAAIATNYISSVRDCDAPDAAAGDPACGNKFGDYLTVDLQAGIETRWNSTLTVGVRNAFDQEPRLSDYASGPSASGAFYNLHDIDGRVPYVRYVQRF